MTSQEILKTMCTEWEERAEQAEQARLLRSWPEKTGSTLKN